MQVTLYSKALIETDDPTVYAAQFDPPPEIVFEPEVWTDLLEPGGQVFGGPYDQFGAATTLGPRGAGTALIGFTGGIVAERYLQRLRHGHRFSLHATFSVEDWVQADKLLTIRRLQGAIRWTLAPERATSRQVHIEWNAP